MRNNPVRVRVMVAAVAAVCASGALAQSSLSGDIEGGLTGDAVLYGDSVTLNNLGSIFFDDGSGATTLIDNQIISIDDGTGQTVTIEQNGMAVQGTGSVTLSGNGDIDASGNVSAGVFSGTGGATSNTLVLDNNGMTVADPTAGSLLTVADTGATTLGNASLAGSLAIADGVGGNSVLLDGVANTITGTTSTISGGSSSAVFNSTGVAVTGATSITGALEVSDNSTLSGAVNTIGNVGTSVNTLTGTSNAITATGANTISGATNAITGTTSTTISGGSSSAVFTDDGVAMTGAIKYDNGAGATTRIDNQLIYIDDGTGQTVTIDQSGMAVQGTGSVVLSGNGDIDASGNVSAGVFSGTGGATSNTLVLDNNGMRVADPAAGLLLTVANTGATTLGNASLAGSLAIADGAGGNSVLLDGVANTITGTTSSSIRGANAGAQFANNSAQIGVTGGAGASFTANTASVTTVTSGGLVITDNTSAVVTGGSATAGTNMTLNNAGVTFANNTGGTPVTVTGVADGVNPYDAVNVRQVQNIQNQMRGMEKLLSAGIAASTASANIPNVESGKTASFGMGLGFYNGRTAMAVGGSYRFSDNGQIKASVATALDGGGRKSTVGVGAGWSW